MMPGRLRHSRSHRAKVQDREARRRYAARIDRMYQEAQDALRDAQQIKCWGGRTAIVIGGRGV